MATSYNPYYSGGWQSGEEGGTPITPDALNHMDDGIAGAYDYTQQSTAFRVGDTFSFHRAQISFRTLNDKSGIYFRYRMPKDIGSDVTGFTVNITTNSTTTFSGGSIGAVPSGATASNISITGNSIAFSVTPSGTIQSAGFGICELDATITFT